MKGTALSVVRRMTRTAASRTEVNGPVAVSVAEYEYRRRRRSMDEVTAPRCRCPRCHRMVDNGVLIHFMAERHRAIGCVRCAPATRRCPRCRRVKPLRNFNVAANKRLGFKLESYCQTCRRHRGTSQYARHKAERRRVASAQRCNVCKRMRAASFFYRDGRYTSGLLPTCKTCRLEKERARYTTTSGAATRRFANQRWHGERSK